MFSIRIFLYSVYIFALTLTCMQFKYSFVESWVLKSCERQISEQNKETEHFLSDGNAKNRVVRVSECVMSCSNECWAVISYISNITVINYYYDFSNNITVIHKTAHYLGTFDASTLTDLKSNNTIIARCIIIIFTKT